MAMSKKKVLTVAYTLLFLLSTLFVLQGRLVSSVSGFSAGATENSWTTLAPLPRPYYGFLGAAEIEGKIYFIGSNYLSGNGICYLYDPETDRWTARTPPPMSNSLASVVACQNKIYVIGGWKDVPIQVYDPATNLWENKTSIPNKTRIEQKACVLNGKIYLIGGGYPGFGFNPSNENSVYDPETDSWSEMAPIPVPVMGYASVVLDGKIYIIGGGTATATLIDATNIVQIFDPETNHWTNGTPIPTGVHLAGACVASGLSAPKRIYVVGGTLRYGDWWLSIDATAASGTNLNQVYDSETGKWSSAAPISKNRWDFSLVNINDVLYAVGGVNSSVQSKEMMPEKEAIAATMAQAVEKYIPLGYETQSPSPSPSPSPFPIPTVEPTTEPTSTPKQQSGFLGTNLPTEYGYALVAVLVIVAVAGLSLIYLKKVKRKSVLI